MQMRPNRGRSVVSALAVIGIGAAAACTSGPSIRSDYDRSADFSEYRTYGFASELGTDRAGYSTLVTEHFKRAVGRELEARGYRYEPTDPDVIVNFYTSVRQETDVRRTPAPTVGVGYYGYRYGLYTAWPLYADEVTTVNYRVGTANVDIVDAERRQLVWEGVAEGRLSEKALENPGAAIDNVVAELFTRYPTQAGSSAG